VRALPRGFLFREDQANRVQCDLSRSPQIGQMVSKNKERAA
jgi:hypothetical protein